MIVKSSGRRALDLVSSRREMLKRLLGSTFALGLAACAPPTTVPNSGDKGAPVLTLPTPTKAANKTGLGTKKTTYTNHMKTINDMAWSPDGKRLATASDDGTVRVWEALSGNTLVTYKGHGGSVFSVSWSPDGRYIVSGGVYQEDGKTIQVWEADTGKFVLKYSEDGNDVKVVRYSHNGRFIVSSGGDVAIRVWQASDGTTLRTFAGGEPGSTTIALAWSPDDDTIAYASNEGPIFHTHSSNDQIVAFKGHTAAPQTLGWSPDGNFLLSASPDSTVRIWNKQNGGTVRTYAGTAAMRAAAWSPDGKQIASGGDDHIVQIWNPLNGVTSYSYKEHEEAISLIAWSPDSTLIASASADMTVQVWQARDAG